MIVVTEKSGEGIDLIYSSVTYTASSYVEDLYLTGTSNINGSGNSLEILCWEILEIINFMEKMEMMKSMEEKVMIKFMAGRRRYYLRRRWR